MINAKNWNTHFYKTDKNRAFISFGAQESQDLEQVELLYFVTLADHDHREIFQTAHLELDAALSEINRKYTHWELSDGQGEGGGCGSCEAK